MLIQFWYLIDLLKIQYTEYSILFWSCVLISSVTLLLTQSPVNTHLQVFINLLVLTCVNLRTKNVPQKFAQHLQYVIHCIHWYLARKSMFSMKIYQWADFYANCIGTTHTFLFNTRNKFFASFTVLHKHAVKMFSGAVWSLGGHSTESFLNF